jgi:hypothetical protein
VGLPIRRNSKPIVVESDEVLRSSDVLWLQTCQRLETLIFAGARKSECHHAL